MSSCLISASHTKVLPMGRQNKLVEIQDKTLSYESVTERPLDNTNVLQNKTCT